MRCSADSWRDMMWGRKPIFGKTKAPIRPELESELGAGDENRTRTICLEGRGSTIELHPRTAWATDITITHKLRSCKTGACSLRKFITWFGSLWCRGFLVSCVLERSFSPLDHLGLSSISHTRYETGRSRYYVDYQLYLCF